MNRDEAQRAIKDVFEHLNVKRVVCVDDAYATKPGLDDARAMIQTLIIQERVDACNACLDYEVPIQPDGGEWEGILEDVWKGNPGKQKEWMRRLYLELDEDNKMKLDQPTSFVAAASLREIVESIGVEFIEMPPSAWAARQASLVREAKEDSKTLFLFDHHLHNDPDYSSKLHGTKLMGQVLKDPNPSILCGLLSGKFTIGNEREAGRTYSQEIGKPLSSWWPISKHRLDQPELFAEGVKSTALNHTVEQLIEKAIDMTHNALADSDTELRKLSAYDLHQAVVESSRSEAVWEIDTLFRLLNVFLNNEVYRFRHKDRAELDRLTDLIHRLDAVSAPSSDPPSPEVRRIRRIEMYEEEYLNAFHAPLRLGDVFKIGSNEYILLAQPCDLMVREGSRRNPIVPLVRVIRHPSKPNRNQNAAPITHISPMTQVAEQAPSQMAAEPQVTPVENTAREIAPGPASGDTATPPTVTERVRSVSETESLVTIQPAAKELAKSKPDESKAEETGNATADFAIDDKEHLRKPIYHYYDESNPHGVVYFKEVIYIPTSVLDLAVFRGDGQCVIEVDSENPPGLRNLIGQWRAHYDKVRTEFKDLANAIQLVRGTPLNNQQLQQLEKAVAARYRPEGVKAPQYRQNGKNGSSITAIDFRISRVKHYREPWSTILLQQFTNYLGRPALEHDYSDGSSTDTPKVAPACAC